MSREKAAGGADTEAIICEIVSDALRKIVPLIVGRSPGEYHCSGTRFGCSEIYECHDTAHSCQNLFDCTGDFDCRGGTFGVPPPKVTE